MIGWLESLIGRPYTPIEYLGNNVIDVPWIVASILVIIPIYLLIKMTIRIFTN